MIRLLLLAVFVICGSAEDNVLIDPVSGYSLTIPFAKTTRVGKGVSTEQVILETWKDTSSGVEVNFMINRSEAGEQTEEGIVKGTIESLVRNEGYSVVDFPVDVHQRKRLGKVVLVTKQTSTQAFILKLLPNALATVIISGEKREAVQQAVTWIYSNNK